MPQLASLLAVGAGPGAAETVGCRGDLRRNSTEGVHGDVVATGGQSMMEDNESRGDAHH